VQSNGSYDFSGTTTDLTTTASYTFSSTPTAVTYYRRRAEDPTNLGTYVYTAVVTYTPHTPNAITATASATTVPPGASVTLDLTGEAGGTQSYLWNNSAGTTKSVIVTAASTAGTTDYNVTVTDAQSCDVVSSNVTITVVALSGGQIEDAAGAIGTIQLCSGTAPGQLYGDGVAGTSTLGSGGTGVANEIAYQWQKKTTGSFGDIGAATSENLNFTDLVTNGTPVVVRRKATNMGIDAYSNELTFDAPALPSPTATATARKLAPGGSTTLNVGSFTSYAWTLTSTGAAIPAVGGVAQTSLQNPSTGALTQTTDFTVTVTDALNCTGTDTVLVTVAPLTAGTTGGDATYCHDAALPPAIANTTPASGGSGGGYNYLCSRMVLMILVGLPLI
jgi:hypothetical protein